MSGPIETGGLPARDVGARRAVHGANDNDAPSVTALPPVVAAAIALADGRRGAISLRLDPARHMRLRIACAIGGRSAQAIIREALDTHFQTIPGMERLMAALTEGGDHAVTGRGTER